MRKWISILVMVAFVMTTTMPVSSHAMMQPEVAKAVQTQQAAKGHDCHHGAKADSAKTTQHKSNTANKSCCDEGACKCLNGFCHGGLAKIFNNGSDAPSFSYLQSRFGSANESADSALLEGLKRPPRA
jgi:hypothetical protein